MIDAVELESEAAARTQENINRSPWAERINVHTTDILQRIAQQTVRFDLIISDPPYYQQRIEHAIPQREQARYTATLDRPLLLTCTTKCITEERFFCVVLPEQVGNGFTELALSMDWYLRLRTNMAENEVRLPRRALLVFSLQAEECLSNRLVIRGLDQNYSEAYTVLTQTFCLFI